MKLLRRLKRCFFSRDTIPDTRITYSLPNPSVFSKLYNRDELFENVVWSNWPAVIDGFMKRFDVWYFANMKGKDSSYLDFCSLCALVEAFTHYHGDKDWHNQHNYKEFLRKLDAIFRKRLSNPITVTRYDNSKSKWTQSTLKDYADVFYTGVRCALHHHGDLAPYAGMHGTGTIAIEKPNAGKSICGGYSYSIVIFDPSEIKKSLQRWLDRYCNDLKADSASPRSLHFRQTFQNDFGIVIP